MCNPPSQRTAVLCVNLGTPSEPTPDAVYSYLVEFLLDRHVVDLPAFFWKPLLTRLILPRRLPTTVANYRKIWTPYGSPLAYYSQQLVHAIAKRLPADWHCCLAMTYGSPSLAEILTQLKDYRKIKIVPLFPQYSTTTTQAIFDKIATLMSNWENTPLIELIEDYAEEPEYIAALVQRIETAFKQHGEPDRLILSYHGIPLRYVRRRHDPYLDRCQNTTRHLLCALREKGITVPVSHAYQSRFGKGQWSEPNIVPLINQLAQGSCKHIQVLCPGFAVDCVETLEEIAEENKQRFLLQGGEQFYYIPALNDSDAHCQLMISLLTRSRADTLSHCAEKPPEQQKV